MKKLDRLILKSFLGPLVLTFAIAVFVLLMQFLWKYIDDLVGKGLEFAVIAKLLLYASATFVPMALPIAVLFASIMTMGNFGEKYELVAMKAGGISLKRVMMPMAFVALLLTGMAFYFANNVMPAAMLQYRTILYDVTRKKPAINIRPSEYYSDIDGYVIRINKKDPDGFTLHDVTIYDHTKGSIQNNVITAQRGKMQTSADDRYLIFTLYDGCTYSEATSYDDRETRPLTRVGFEKQQITLDISSFAFDESDSKFFEGNYQMMNVKQLLNNAAMLKSGQEERIKNHCAAMMDRFSGLRLFDTTRVVADTMMVPADTIPEAILKMQRRLRPDMMDDLMPHREERLCRAWNVDKSIESAVLPQRRQLVQYALNSVQSQLDQINMQKQIVQADLEYVNRHYIEFHRKFTLSIACFLLFLVGAPFGSLVRKGGLGLPLVASVAFFVLYYVIGMICEKAVRESALPPVGMWISSLVMLPIGIILTVQATTDKNLAMGQWLLTMKERLSQRKNKIEKRNNKA